MQLDGKVAVVTGAASGIGRAMAMRFARADMKVVLADIDAAALGETLDRMKAEFPDVIAVRTDVCDWRSVDELARRAVDAYGTVHVVCNNAGVGAESSAIWELSIEEWEWMIGVNFWSVVHGIRTFIPIMIDSGARCHMVNTASISGLIAGWGTYGVAKHAVVALSESLATQLQLAGADIGVSVVCPAAVNTDIAAGRARRRTWALGGSPGARPSVLADFFKGYRARMDANIAAGISADEVAEQVLDAIQARTFYVLTHPAHQEQRVREYAASILSRRPPNPPAIYSKEALSGKGVGGMPPAGHGSK
jgi:NAD(P)-dependent dehydrogenase (short-subunit alcohol dehydrogenase family)